MKYPGWAAHRRTGFLTVRDAFRSVATMTDLAQARQRLNADKLAFVLVREGKVLATGDDYGVRELLAAVDRLGPLARGASLADKVVGKAVALIVVHGGICAVDTRVASEPAVKLLNAHGIPLQTATIVPQILNRRGDGPCPMEKATMPFEDVGPGLEQLREFIAARRAGVPVPP